MVALRRRFPASQPGSGLRLAVTATGSIMSHAAGEPQSLGGWQTLAALAAPVKAAAASKLASPWPRRSLRFSSAH
eukprot:639920-Rhodomonas_salina.2